MRLDDDEARLDVLAAELVESFRATAQAGNVTIDLQAPDSVTVTGDERWLRQLVSNLADNAVKFSTRPDGARPARVVVAVARGAKGATLTVTDDDPGIPAEALDHIFERFFRVEGARPYATHSGFGLGLSIAAWIVAAHGGVIEARNRPEGGSEFEVRFGSAQSLEKT